MQAAITTVLVMFSVAVRPAGRAEASGTDRVGVVVPAEGSLPEGWQPLEGSDQAYVDLSQDECGAEIEDHRLAPGPLETPCHRGSVETRVPLRQPGHQAAGSKSPVDTCVPDECLRQPGVQARDEGSQSTEPEEARRPTIHPRPAHPEVPIISKVSEASETEVGVPQIKVECPATDGKGIAADGEGPGADGEDDIDAESRLEAVRKVVGAVAAATLFGARMLSESPVTAHWKVWLLPAASLITAAWRLHVWRQQRRPRQDKAS